MTTCNDPGLTSVDNYGNGLIQFTQKSFCSNGVCNDVTVCQVLTSSGEENYYIPVDGTLNEMKELVILYLFNCIMNLTMDIHVITCQKYFLSQI